MPAGGVSGARRAGVAAAGPAAAPALAGPLPVGAEQRGDPSSRWLTVLTCTCSAVAACRGLLPESKYACRVLTSSEPRRLS